MHLLAIYSLVLVLTSAPAWAEEVEPADAALRIVFNSNLEEPYIVKKGNEIVGGVHWDLAQYVGRQLGRPVEMIEVPRKRLEEFLRDGRGHVLLLSNPDWLSNPDLLDWTCSVYTERDLIVQDRWEVFDIHSPADLAGKRLGTLQGYIYKGLFDGQHGSAIIRDNAKSFHSNFLRLKRGRIDALIAPQILVDYLFQTAYERAEFHVVSSWSIPHVLYSGVSPHSPVSAAQLSDVYQAMQRQGDFDALLKRYR